MSSVRTVGETKTLSPAILSDGLKNHAGPLRKHLSPLLKFYR